jgi:hypothetical protein
VRDTIDEQPGDRPSIGLEAFLASRTRSLPEVLAAVDAAITRTTGDSLLAVGSLVEGLGTTKSDLDLILITPDPVMATLGPVTVISGTCVVDVQPIARSWMDQLLRRLDDWSASPWDVTHAAGFTLAERTLMHRMVNCRGLDDSFDDRPTAPDSRSLARLKLHVARQDARTIQVDLVGYREMGDFASLVFASQELLGHGVDALLAGYLQTNPLSKWRTRLLERLRDGWLEAVGLRPVGMTGVDHIWRLHRAPTRPLAAPAIGHALGTTTFARAAFLWAESVLLHGGPIREPFEWPWSSDSDDLPLPALEFDVDYSLADDGATVGRLNEFGRVVELESEELLVMLLCDGTTTERAAQQAVFGTQTSADGERVHRVAAAVAEAGLTQTSPPSGWPTARRT